MFPVFLIPSSKKESDSMKQDAKALALVPVSMLDITEDVEEAVAVGRLFKVSWLSAYPNQTCRLVARRLKQLSVEVHDYVPLTHTASFAAAVSAKIAYDNVVGGARMEWRRKYLQAVCDVAAELRAPYKRTQRVVEMVAKKVRDTSRIPTVSRIDTDYAIQIVGRGFPTQSTFVDVIAGLFGAIDENRVEHTSNGWVYIVPKGG